MMKRSESGRTRVIALRVDEQEHDWIASGAAEMNMSVSDFLRLLGTLKGWTVDMRKRMEDWPELLRQVAENPAVAEATVRQEVNLRTELVLDTFKAVQAMEQSMAKVRLALNSALTGVGVMQGRLNEVTELTQTAEHPEDFVRK
jgi:hypothetical protein